MVDPFGVADGDMPDLIVDTSIENKLGARGLRSICERIMTDAMYDAPSSGKKTFRISLDYAKKKLLNWKKCPTLAPDLEF